MRSKDEGFGNAFIRAHWDAGFLLSLQEEAKNFITPENLDERIEECLNSLKNYNFAIDKEGRIVKRSTLS